MSRANRELGQIVTAGFVMVTFQAGLFAEIGERVAQIAGNGEVELCVTEIPVRAIDFQVSVFSKKPTESDWGQRCTEVAGEFMDCGPAVGSSGFQYAEYSLERSTTGTASICWSFKNRTAGTLDAKLMVHYDIARPSPAGGFDSHYFPPPGSPLLTQPLEPIQAYCVCEKDPKSITAYFRDYSPPLYVSLGRVKRGDVVKVVALGLGGPRSCARELPAGAYSIKIIRMSPIRELPYTFIMRGQRLE